jgi:hypothetical protein
MSIPVLAKSFNAGGAIPANTIVKFGADDNTIVAAAAAADLSIGVSTFVAAATGERCDAILQGEADVLFGGTVARGAMVTADASGRAVAAVATNRVIGIALVSAVVGDIGKIVIAPSVM